MRKFTVGEFGFVSVSDLQFQVSNLLKLAVGRAVALLELRSWLKLRLLLLIVLLMLILSRLLSVHDKAGVRARAAASEHDEPAETDDAAASNAGPKQIHRPHWHVGSVFWRDDDGANRVVVVVERAENAKVAASAVLAAAKVGAAQYRDKTRRNVLAVLVIKSVAIVSSADKIARHRRTRP